MKIKGFWTSYVNLWNHSLEWLKDYWLLYTIICVVIGLIFVIPQFVYDYKLSKSKYDDDLGDLDD